jgi:hypothetical protein
VRRRDNPPSSVPELEQTLRLPYHI